MTDLLAAALRLAAYGWPVFPCRPGSKEPATAHGFRDATTDPEWIRAWWRRDPSANIGIPTGAPGPDVLDVDVKPGGDGYGALERLKRTGLCAGALAMVATRNGGLHLYYRGTSQPTRGLRGLYVDFKAAGGYVLAPGSTVPADPWVTESRSGAPLGAYTALESRADGRSFDWPAAERLLTPPRPAPRPTGHAYMTGGIDGLARWLAGEQEGNRNHALFWAACRALADGADDLAPLADAAVSIGLGEVEINRTISSARRRVGAA